MVTGIDHVVLTVRDVEAAAAFYHRALGMPVIRFGAGRVALGCGRQKINLHHLGMETRNHAAIGAGDVCLTTDRPLEEVAEHLRDAGIEILEGPVARTGARGPMHSIYFTDPDGNLVEVASYAGPAEGKGPET